MTLGLGALIAPKVIVMQLNINTNVEANCMPRLCAPPNGLLPKLNQIKLYMPPQLTLFPCMLQNRITIQNLREVQCIEKKDH